MNNINKNNSYDIILLVIASRSNIYDKLMQIYWKPLIKHLKENNYKIKIFLIFGNNNKLNELKISSEDIIITDTSESVIPGILIKTLNSYRYIEENYSYKHILRTNLSSFFIIDNLIKISKNLPNENAYAAVIGKYRNNKNILFGSGAGFWLSRDYVLFVLNNKKNLNFNLIDDVAIGNLMKNKKIISLPRYDLDKNINFENKKDLLNNIISNNHYHIRIKNPKNRLIDLDYFKTFTKILYNNLDV